MTEQLLAERVTALTVPLAEKLKGFSGAEVSVWDVATNKTTRCVYAQQVVEARFGVFEVHILVQVKLDQGNRTTSIGVQPRMGLRFGSPEEGLEWASFFMAVATVVYGIQVGQMSVPTEER